MKKDRSPIESVILAAIAQTPFGSLVHARVGRDGAPVTLEQIATYLGELRSVLEQYATKAHDEHVELITLQADVAALRRLMGVAA